MKAEEYGRHRADRAFRFSRDARAHRVAAGLIVGVGLSIFTAHATAEEIKWTFAHTTPIRGSTYDRYASEILPKRLEQVTDGRLKVEVVPGIVAPQDLMKSIRAGRVQAGSMIIAYAAASYPRWTILGLPGLLQKEADYVTAVEQIVLPVIEKEAREAWGARPVAIGAFAGVGVFSRTPLERVDQFKGMKFRTASPEQAQLMKASGGAAVSMPFGELYTSMQRGLVDAFTSSANSVVDAKMHEIVKHATRWPIGLNIWGIFVSEAALTKLPEDIRKKVTDELSRINHEALREGLVDSDKGWARVKEAGIQVREPSAEEFAKAVALARDNVWPNWLERAGAEGPALLERVQNIGKSK